MQVRLPLRPLCRSPCITAVTFRMIVQVHCSAPQYSIYVHCAMHRPVFISTRCHHHQIDMKLQCNGKEFVIFVGYSMFGSK